MIPPAFEYLRPKTVPEAVAMLQQHGDDAKILSGGQSLIPMMKLRLARPSHLIDITRVNGLSYIKEEGGFLKIGGFTREAEVEASDLIRKKYPLLLDTATVIADPQVRNMATVGGNLAHGDPANDHPATMMALRAQVVATGAKGERVIPIDDFFVTLFTTALNTMKFLLRSVFLCLRQKVAGLILSWSAKSATLPRLQQRSSSRWMAKAQSSRSGSA